LSKQIHRFETEAVQDSDGLTEMLRLLRVDAEIGALMEQQVQLFRFMGKQQVVMSIDMHTGLIDLPGNIEQTDRARQFIDCVNQLAPMYGLRAENALLKGLLARALKRGISPQDALRAEIEEALR
jgi:hypothetical protein